MSGIEWTDRSDWNPVRGCTRVSPGCGGPGKHGGCYAEVIAARFSDEGQPFHGFAERTPGGPRWTGKVSLIENHLLLPLKWQKPAKIFANSMSDFFHESLPRRVLVKVFAVMIAAGLLRGHILQVLTKRAKYMRQVLNDRQFWEDVNIEVRELVRNTYDPLTIDDYGPDNPPPWIWLGTSCENQDAFDERWPDLEATPAAVRYLSMEPLLEFVDICGALGTLKIRIPKNVAPMRKFDGGTTIGDAVRGLGGSMEHVPTTLSWIIVGGESGRNARPMHPDWARSIRNGCELAGVPFFFKQWGEWIDADQWLTSLRSQGFRFIRDGHEIGSPLNFEAAQALANGRHYEHQSDGRTNIRVGKKAAGRLLDGRTHDAMPVAADVASAGKEQRPCA